MSDNNIPVKEIGEMLDEVSAKLPKLINGLMASLYSAEAGKNMGQAIGSLYKELIASGIPAEDALKMAKDYMLSLKDISSNLK
jgi:hypothetical protein